VALSTEVINFIWLYGPKDPIDAAPVRKISVMENKLSGFDMRLFVKVIDPSRIKRTRPADDPMDFIPFFEQELG
jgi:hypothetical protein